MSSATPEPVVEPRIETARLVLRRLTPADADFICALLNEPSFLRFIGDRGVRTTEDAREYIQAGPMASYAAHGFGLLLVELASTSEPVGICGLLKRDTLPDVEVGFALLPRYWSQGYAFEAASAVLDDGRRTFGLTRIVAITSPDNVASGRLLEKLGFTFEGLITLTPASTPVRLFASHG